MPWPPPFMPGCGGIRADANGNSVFINVENKWGWRCDCEKGSKVYNFVRWPEELCHKKARAPGAPVGDLDRLVEVHHRHNLKRAGGHYRCWSELWDRHEGETLVIASTGPSLTRSLPALYKYRDRFKLLTINRGLRCFNRQDVQADYFYFVERRGRWDWVYETNGQGEPLAPFDSLGKTTLITTPQGDHELIEHFDADNTFYGFSGLGPLGHHAEVARLKTFDVMCSTTLGNAPYIAWKLGFERVILVGVDFAVELEFAVDHEIGEAELRALRGYFDRYEKQVAGGWRTESYDPVMGNDGTCTGDNHVLKSWCSQFAAVLDILQYEGGLEIINASAAGILRWNNRDLEEVLRAL